MEPTYAEMKVRVADLQGKVQLTGKGHTSQTVRIDYLPPLGEGQGFTSIELLMISLASCSAHTILFLLARSEAKVDTIEVNVVGQRRMNEHPTVLKKVELDYSITGEKLNGLMIEKMIQTAEEKLCPVWAMLKPTVEIAWTYKIRNKE